MRILRQFTYLRREPRPVQIQFNETDSEQNLKKKNVVIKHGDIAKQFDILVEQ